MSGDRCIEAVRKGERCGNSATHGNYCQLHAPEVVRDCPLCGSEGRSGEGYTEDEFVTCVDETKKCAWYNWVIPFKAWQALPRTRRKG